MKRPIFDPAWPEDIKALYKHDVREIWDLTIAKHIWNQYHNQLEIYMALAEGFGPLTILDVGCAQGTLALLLAEQGHEVWAVDIRQQFLDYAASRYERGTIHFKCGNALELDLGKSFDLIFANQIVEHLLNPFGFISRLSQWLKPGGRLVVTTPNAEYVKNGLPSFAELGDTRNLESRQFSADGDGHFFAYRADELKGIFEESGLTDVAVRFFETPFISGHMKIRYLHRLIPSRVFGVLDRAVLSFSSSKRIAHQLMVSGAIKCDLLNNGKLATCS